MGKLDITFFLFWRYNPVYFKTMLYFNKGSISYAFTNLYKSSTYFCYLDCLLQIYFIALLPKEISCLLIAMLFHLMLQLTQLIIFGQGVLLSSVSERSHKADPFHASSPRYWVPHHTLCLTYYVGVPGRSVSITLAYHP